MNAKTLSMAVALAMVLTVLAPGGIAAAETAGNEAGNHALTVDVNQTDEDVEVWVTKNDTDVENATVDVASEGGNYSGIGTYTTDGDGLVSLPLPEENVTVGVTAERGDDVGHTTATLSAMAEQNETFGQRVSAFVQEVRSDSTTGIGGLVASFVIENNPGNAPAHAGPDDGGDSTNSTETDDGNATAESTDGSVNTSETNPDRAGPKRDDAKTGKPDHVGNASNGKPGHAGSSDANGPAAESGHEGGNSDTNAGDSDAGNGGGNAGGNDGGNAGDTDGNNGGGPAESNRGNGKSKGN